MSLREDLLGGYTAMLAELRWELRAREATGELRDSDLDAINRWGASTQTQIQNLKREIAAYERLREALPVHCRPMSPHSGG